MTQEEILKEAKITEKINLESLKKYQEMELEAKRKAIRSGIRTVKGPAIRYQSLTMPLIEDLKSDTKGKTEENKNEEAEKKESHGSQERTFISFTDSETLKNNFPKSNSRIPSPKVCPVTRLPAKYFDPVTELPYANLQGIDLLAFCQQC